MTRYTWTYPTVSDIDNEVATQLSGSPPAILPSASVLSAGHVIHSGTHQDQTWNSLVRWDTSDLPSNAAIVSADLRLYCYDRTEYPFAFPPRELWIEWYLMNGTEADFRYTPVGDAHPGTLISNIVKSQHNLFALDAVDERIDKNGLTGLRLHMYPSQSQTMVSFVSKRTGITGADPPQLIVTFDTPDDVVPPVGMVHI